MDLSNSDHMFKANYFVQQFEKQKFIMYVLCRPYRPNEIHMRLFWHNANNYRMNIPRKMRISETRRTWIDDLKD